MVKAILLTLSVILICLSGCADKAIYRQAAESGWDRWEEDHRKVISDEEYNNLPDSEEARALYLPQTLFDARRFEKDQALRLLKD
ncbi:MAG: hypothetical protein M5U25_21085 [Planctomycetota bacterium]|nr:hypothetical protein [Planctomycetota bacterium]